MEKDCFYMNKYYSHGSLLKLTGENLLCNDGTWEKEIDRPDPCSTISPGKDLGDI